MEMRKKTDFWGHWDSMECEWHIIGTPIEFKYHMIFDVIDFIKNNINICHSKIDYIMYMEIKFAKYLIMKNYKADIVISEKTLQNKNGLICPIFHPKIISQWINNPKTFAIKWKYCISYLDSSVISPEFNFLARFLHYGPYGTISDGETSGAFPSSKNL